MRFTGLASYSLDVTVRAYVRTTDFSEFLAIQEDLLLRIMGVVKRAGTGFAFPLRTLYHRPDAGIDSDLQQAAEGRVREWSSSHTLPFPEFTEAYREQITDTLEYPPAGSSGVN